MSRVYVKFPGTGLGNLMLIWAKACVFAHLNNLPLVTSPWWGFRLGAWLRNENKKRLYWGYFRENTFFERVFIKGYRLLNPVRHEPVVQVLSKDDLKVNTLYFFSQVSTDNDLFGAIRNHRDYIREQLYEMLTPALLQKLKLCTAPEIAVHIRRGDFKIANPVTPQSFFIDCINLIRTNAKNKWPVTIFTDADESEIKDVMVLPNVVIASRKPDILDILLMSKSKIIVLSQSSTFGYWGAFLSDGVVIVSPDDWQQKIKDEKAFSKYKEIRWKPGVGDEKIIDAVAMI